MQWSFGSDLVSVFHDEGRERGEAGSRVEMERGGITNSPSRVDALLKSLIYFHLINSAFPVLILEVLHHSVSESKVRARALCW